MKASKWTKIGESLREALATYAGAHEFPSPQGSMAALIDEALAEIRRGLKPSTVKQYEQATKTLKRKFAQFTPEQVKPRHVAQLKRDLAKTPNMANRSLSVLRQVFAHGLEQQLPGIDANPVVGIRRHKEAKRTRLISIAEYVAIHKKAGPRLQVIMDLSVRTGERIGDVLRIRRTDLLDEGIRLEQMKTGAKRIVPWTLELRVVVGPARQHPGAEKAKFGPTGKEVAALLAKPTHELVLDNRSEF